MNKSPIHDDDYGAIDRQHSMALAGLCDLSIDGFSSMANDILMRLQDQAYQLGVERGKKMAEEQQG